MPRYVQNEKERSFWIFFCPNRTADEQIWNQLKAISQWIWKYCDFAAVPKVRLYLKDVLSATCCNTWPCQSLQLELKQRLCPTWRQGLSSSRATGKRWIRRKPAWWSKLIGHVIVLSSSKIQFQNASNTTKKIIMMQITILVKANQILWRLVKFSNHWSNFIRLIMFFNVWSISFITIGWVGL